MDGVLYCLGLSDLSWALEHSRRESDTSVMSWVILTVKESSARHGGYWTREARG